LRSVLGPAANSVERDDTNMRVGAHAFATEVGYGLNSTLYYVGVQERFVISIGGTSGNVILRHAQGNASSDQTVMRAESYMVIKNLING
jgi:hypothetical protein